MENVNLSPDQLKGILSLYVSGKLQSVFEEASCSTRSHSAHCNGPATSNATTSPHKDNWKSEATRPEKFNREGSPESAGEDETDSEEIFLESKDTAQTYS